MRYIFAQTNLQAVDHGDKSVWTAANKAWKSRWTADISLLLVALVWGSSYVATKDVVSTVPVFQFLFIRFILTTILMLPLTIRALQKADRYTWISGVSFGLLLLAVFSFETLGVANTSAANAGFIISLFVVMTPMIESVFYRHIPKVGLFGAVLLSVLGTALLTLHGYHINIGDFLVLGAAFFRAALMTVTKKMTDGKVMNSGALTTIQLAVVAIGCGAVTLIHHASFGGFSVSFWLITCYLAIFGTIFAFFIQLTMIQRTTPSRVAVLMSSEPVFAAVFSVLLLGERLSIASMIGGMCIVVGMLWGRKLS